jgi:phosphoribosyl 1,2-cyclic phosphate phosphodiesterase
VHGIDDLRAVSARRGPLAVYGSAATLTQLARRFPYIFDPAVRPQPGTSKPQLVPTPLAAGQTLEIAGLPVLPLAVPHGDLDVFAYRIGPVAYVTDAKRVPPDVVARLRGVRVLVVNALFDRPHPTHLSIPEAVEVARAVGAERTLLTHLTHRHSYAALAASLPDGVEPAYDGLAVAF